MKIPVVRGVIDRRILVNYHVDPTVLQPLLPAPFRPKVVRGVGMVGFEAAFPLVPMLPARLGRSLDASCLSPTAS
jgi:hypothetical protein